MERDLGGKEQAGRDRLVIPILATANFIIGIGAFLVIGIMAPLIDDLGISAARGGWVMTTYALSYALLSPLLVSLSGSVGRRRVLAAGLALFGLSCVLSALAPNDIVLNAARVVAAAGAGLVTPVAAAVAAGLSAPEAQGRSLAAVFLGLTLAQVVGIPAGAFIAYAFGWRAAFWIVAVLTVPVVAAIWWRVPAGLSFRPVGLGDLGRTLGDPRQMLVILYTASFIGALYVVYTFMSPLLTETMGFGRDAMTLALLIYGFGAVAGNFLGGQLSDRIGAYRTLLILAVSQVILMPINSLLPLPVVFVFALMFVWPMLGWSFMPAQQMRLIALAPERAPVMMALNAASIYVGAALGSALGGAILSRWGLGALGIGGGIAALWAVVHLVLSNRVARD